jgi:hypothetical protein
MHPLKLWCCEHGTCRPSSAYHLKFADISCIYCSSKVRRMGEEQALMAWDSNVSSLLSACARSRLASPTHTLSPPHMRIGNLGPISKSIPLQVTYKVRVTKPYIECIQNGYLVEQPPVGHYQKETSTKSVVLSLHGQVHGKGLLYILKRRK